MNALMLQQQYNYAVLFKTISKFLVQNYKQIINTCRKLHNGGL